MGPCTGVKPHSVLPFVFVVGDFIRKLSGNDCHRATIVCKCHYICPDTNRNLWLIRVNDGLLRIELIVHPVPVRGHLECELYVWTDPLPYSIIPRWPRRLKQTFAYCKIFLFLLTTKASGPKIPTKTISAPRNHEESAISKESWGILQSGL